MRTTEPRLLCPTPTTTAKSPTPEKHSSSQAEANSEEYHKIETDIFNLQRERQEARKKTHSSKPPRLHRTEAERRIQIANDEKERLQKAGEETARALAASQKQQTAASEAEQKRLTTGTRGKPQSNVKKPSAPQMSGS